MGDKLSRRDVLQQSAALGAFVAFGSVACSKPAALACVDTTGLSATDMQVRTALVYVDKSTEAGKTCLGCLQYVPPPAAGSCGTCKIVKGPINPAGYCKSFVAKPA
jgi:hypothetical protein